MFDSSQTLYREILQSTTPCTTCATPVQVSRGTTVARCEERIGSTTPMSMIARKAVDHEFFLTSGNST